MFELIAFYVFAAFTLCTFLIVVISSDILYALTALAFGMILISGFFFLLNADFLGVVQIIVYTGAVAVMYAFGMMFFDSNKGIRERFHNQFFVSCISGVIMLALLIILGNAESSGVINTTNDMSTGALAHLLFNKYLVCFEAAAVMLLMAMIAGIAAGANRVKLYKEDTSSNSNASLYEKDSK